MALVGLVLLIVFGVVCVGLRTWVHVRRTGESPFRDGPVGSGRLAVAAFAAPFAAALLLDAAGRGRLVHGVAFGVAGAVLALVGVALTLWSQLAMGDSWRIGVDLEEHTTLVTRGPYRVVRNPIYTGMFAFAAGFTMVVPNVVSLIGFVGVLVGITAVVRRVEEPYLASRHGAAFETWAATTGRFVPGVGQVVTRMR